VRFLRAEFATRYRESRRERYDAASYRRGATFSVFDEAARYPPN
jgi:hypothetical protein